ncbi:nuclear transport factor 2 family protein [Teredinibacter haidensis]|uniref:nuclear transport factor 2 family protein n=1 Tax=Teredinibacter haidensis TaxID=2731755 RepID=UPI000948D33A|nr:nuclear transport factor 2 family protein [Teredinibacter haidensis]
MKQLLRGLVTTIGIALLCSCVVVMGPEKINDHVLNHENENHIDDQKGITEAVLNYVEGWYSSDAGRMESALSMHLAKRRITPDEQLISVSKEWMVKETGDGRGRIPHPDRGRKEITILAQTDTIASVVLLSDEFVDYLHLVKAGGSWKIANALWDYPSK